MPNNRLFLLLCRLPFLHPKQRFHLPRFLLHVLMPWKIPLVLLLNILMPWKIPLLLVLHILMPWNSLFLLLRHFLMPWNSPLLLVHIVLMPWNSNLVLLLHFLMPWKIPLVLVLHFRMPWKISLVLVLQLLWLPHLVLSLRHSSSSNLYLYPCCSPRNSVLNLYLLYFPVLSAVPRSRRRYLLFLRLRS